MFYLPKLSFNAIVEELGHIQDLPIECKTNYKHAMQNTSVSTLSGIMKVHHTKLGSKITKKGNSKGIPQGFSEWHLRQLAEKEIGETFMDVLAFTLMVLCFSQALIISLNF